MEAITIEDLHLFHTIDRRVFSRLLINLARCPAESLLVMSLWLWLEDLHSQSIVDKMVDFSDSVVDALANEAVLCLKWLESRSSAGAGAGEDDMPLTSVVTGRPMTSHRFYPNKFAAISGIKAFLNKTHLSLSRDSPTPYSAQSTLSQETRISLSPTADSGVGPRPPRPRGYPVSEEEVKELFNSYYGDCVETVKMVPPMNASEQSLYARLVVRSVSTIDQVLSRGPIAKFRVNGKHVWARKYERRDMYVDK
nr:uncharacterized protein LOC109169472 [Ipomoea batatas]